MIIKDILLKAVGYENDEELLENLELLTNDTKTYKNNKQIASGITYVNKETDKCMEYSTITYNEETDKISAKYKLVDYNENFYTLLKTDYESFAKSIYSLELYTYTTNKLIGSVCFDDTINKFVFVLCDEYKVNTSSIYNEKRIGRLMMYILPKIYQYLDMGNKLLEQYNSNNVEQDLKTIFSTNLSYYMNYYNKSCSNISEVLNTPYSTVNDWVNGKSYPRMVQIQQLADYFDISKSDLIEQQKDRFYDIYKNYIKEY